MRTVTNFLSQEIWKILGEMLNVENLNFLGNMIFKIGINIKQAILFSLSKSVPCFWTKLIFYEKPRKRLPKIFSFGFADLHKERLFPKKKQKTTFHLPIFSGILLINIFKLSDCVHIGHNLILGFFIFRPCSTLQEKSFFPTIKTIISSI